MKNLTRRTLITTGGATVLGTGAIILAGCAPGGASDGNSGQSSSLSAGVELAALSEIPIGGTKAVTIDGHEILLAQPTKGEVVAFSAICTHRGCVVSASKTEFDCHCHGSQYEAATGNVLRGPAERPLTPIAVTVTEDKVLTA